MSTTQSERLRGLLEPLVGSAGLDLEEIEVTPAGKRRVLRVVVDSDEGVELDACAELSRRLSEKLDETDAMGEVAYVLEVSSPGAERPLSEPRHFRRALGRLMKAQLAEAAGGEELVARIMSVDETGVDVEIPGVKGRKPKARRLDFGDIAKARVEIEFNNKGAARVAAQQAQHESAAVADEDEGKEEA